MTWGDKLKSKIAICCEDYFIHINDLVECLAEAEKKISENVVTAEAIDYARGQIAFIDELRGIFKEASEKK